MVPKLHPSVVSTHQKTRIFNGKDLPKSSLNTPNIILPPIPPRHLLLSHRHSIPHHPHQRNSIPIVLIEFNLKSTEMTFRPLRQSPLLDNLCRFLELAKLATDVAAEKLEFAAYMCAFEDFGRCTGEGCKAVGRGEGSVEFGGCSAELFCGSYGCGIHMRAFAGGWPLVGSCG